MARESVRIEGLDVLLRRLKALGPAASKRGGPVRAAVRKGAVVIQKAAQANIAEIVADPNVGGENGSTGLLEKSVTPLRARAPQNYKGETYFVTIPRRARYPIDKRTPTGIDVATVGKMLEYGTSKRRPYPWMGPAFNAKKGEAADVMADELENGIARLEKKGRIGSQMIPAYGILHDWQALAAIVGTRIYRGNAGSDPVAPYVVWRTLAGVPDNHLSGPPPSDRYSVRVDCFADTEAASDELFAACRDALEQAGQVQNFQDLGEEDQTNLWRYTIDADIFRNR